MSRALAGGVVQVFCPLRGGVECRWHAQGSAFTPNVVFFAPDSLEEAAKFFCLFVLLSRICPNCTVQAVISSPIQFLCFLLLEESFVQRQALQHRSRGSRVPATCPTEGPGDSARGKSRCGIQPMIEIQAVPALICDCLMEKGRVCIFAFPFASLVLTYLT